MQNPCKNNHLSPELWKSFLLTRGSTCIELYYWRESCWPPPQPEINPVAPLLESVEVALEICSVPLMDKEYAKAIIEGWLSFLADIKVNEEESAKVFRALESLRQALSKFCNVAWGSQGRTRGASCQIQVQCWTSSGCFLNLGVKSKDFLGETAFGKGKTQNCRWWVRVEASRMAPQTFKGQISLAGGRAVSSSRTGFQGVGSIEGHARRAEPRRHNHMRGYVEW